MQFAFTHFIIHYGYLAIFSLVFLQELGVPNPVTNEFVLLFGGYLAFQGKLSLPLVFLSAVSADIVGTTVLYFVFYAFGTFLFAKKRSWLPVPTERIDAFKERVSRRGLVGIYVGRLIPFVRGYTSVAAGLLRIRPAVFLTAIVVSAVTWSGGYVLVGNLVGPYWERVASDLGTMGQIVAAAFIIVALFALGTYVSSKRGPRGGVSTGGKTGTRSTD